MIETVLPTTAVVQDMPQASRRWKWEGVFYDSENELKLKETSTLIVGKQYILVLSV